VLGQCNKERADRAYRTYLAIRDMHMAKREPDVAYERSAYIYFLTRILELLQLPEEYDTQMKSEVYSDDIDSVIESDTDIELVVSPEIDICEYNTEIENKAYSDELDSVFESDTEPELTDSIELDMCENQYKQHHSNTSSVEQINCLYVRQHLNIQENLPRTQVGEAQFRS